MMRWLFAVSLLVGCVLQVEAHHPDRENMPVHRRIDLIPPLGNSLPPSYRRVYNRPTYWGGKIAYHIAPSSQEAMAWHDAVHRGLYKNNSPRVEKHYFFPKPWEALRIGARVPTDPALMGDESSGDAVGSEYDTNRQPLAPVPVEPLVDENEPGREAEPQLRDYLRSGEQ